MQAIGPNGGEPEPQAIAGEVGIQMTQRRIKLSWESKLRLLF